MTNEQWTEEVLRSLGGMSRAPMPDTLRNKLIAQMPDARSRDIGLARGPRLWLMAAGLILLVGLNAASVLVYERGQRPPDMVANRSDANPVAAEYFAPPPSI